MYIDAVPNRNSPPAILLREGCCNDGKRDDPQIVLGLVCTAQGCPIAVELLKGNTADPATVATQLRTGLVVSRNSVTAMGLDLAARLGIALCGRASGLRLLCYTSAEGIAIHAAA